MLQAVDESDEKVSTLLECTDVNEFIDRVRLVDRAWADTNAGNSAV